LSEGRHEVVEASADAEASVACSRFVDEAHQARLVWAGRMLAGVVHEVNNPLTAIRTYAHMLHERAATEEDRRDLLCILEETRRLGTLVEDMLRFTRRGREGLDPVDLCRVVHAALNLMRHELRLAGITAVASLPDEPLLARAQHGVCVQVLLNVLANARQSLEELRGEPRGIVVRSAPAAPGLVALHVTNNGPPIPADVAARIFEPFFTTKSTEGCGLGLAVCRELLERVGGSITLHENGGAGVCFRLEFAAG
jgi:two-component system, NtrC family, phosphoglycerate transport system sensor histidine kinase PgtB